MIKVVYNNKIIKINGHANFADYGKDIVCASVSSIVYTTVNGILNINNKAIIFQDNKEIVIEVISNDDITKSLIDNMLNLLMNLAIQYPKNIKISKGD